MESVRGVRAVRAARGSGPGVISEACGSGIIGRGQAFLSKGLFDKINFTNKEAQMLKTPTKSKVQSEVSKAELFDYLRDIY